VLALGNLSGRRDFTDVRDVVRAYRALMDRGAAGEIYNLSSGCALEISRIVDIAMNLSKVPIRLESGDDRTRPLDSPLLVGDSSKLRKNIGWEPRISIEQSIRDALDHARASLRRRLDRFETDIMHVVYRALFHGTVAAVMSPRRSGRCARWV
jgi:GDP-4-dehydro-6-deoxy-D-mannose reductase